MATGVWSPLRCSFSYLWRHHNHAEAYRVWDISCPCYSFVCHSQKMTAFDAQWTNASEIPLSMLPFHATGRSVSRKGQDMSMCGFTSSLKVPLVQWLEIDPLRCLLFTGDRPVASFLRYWMPHTSITLLTKSLWHVVSNTSVQGRKITVRITIITSTETSLGIPLDKVVCYASELLLSCRSLGAGGFSFLNVPHT